MHDYEAASKATRARRSTSLLEGKLQQLLLPRREELLHSPEIRGGGSHCGCVDELAGVAEGREGRIEMERRRGRWELARKMSRAVVTMAGGAAQASLASLAAGS
jgi:hypothetical protein